MRYQTADRPKTSESQDDEPTFDAASFSSKSEARHFISQAHHKKDQRRQNLQEDDCTKESVSDKSSGNAEPIFQSVSTLKRRVICLRKRQSGNFTNEFSKFQDQGTNVSDEPKWLIDEDGTEVQISESSKS